MRRALLVVVVALGALVLAAPGAHAQYNPGQPGFILTPSTTPPGGTITAVGFGCGRNQTVTITINGSTVGTGQSGNTASGEFSISFTAPTTPGSYVVTATCGNIIQTSILTVQAPPTTISGGLPATGSDVTVSLTRVGLGLLMVGGLIVLLTRRRRDATT